MRAVSHDPGRISYTRATLQDNLLQALLVERFKLVLHHETRDFPVYELVVGKNGPKLTGFPRMLRTAAGRLVLDKTGLAGEYDFTLEFKGDPPNPNDSDPAPSLFDALERRAGHRSRG